MTITIGLYVIPTIVTIVLLAIMFRPIGSDRYGFGALFRILWLIPILIVWVLYLIVKAASK